MQCPCCPGTALVMSERQGVEIDYCPNCRGVWLDRGELDKLIERSVQQPPPTAAAAPAGYAPRDHGYTHKRKQRSWLEDIFD